MNGIHFRFGGKVRKKGNLSPIHLHCFLVAAPDDEVSNIFSISGNKVPKVVTMVTMRCVASCCVIRRNTANAIKIIIKTRRTVPHELDLFSWLCLAISSTFSLVSRKLRKDIVINVSLLLFE